MKRLFLKLSLFIYRLIGSLVIIFAMLHSFLYFTLPIVMSGDKVKIQVLQTVSLPIQFKKIDWNVWGLSPTIVIHDVALYQHKVQKIIIELDWIEWIKTSKIKVKKVFLKKADLLVQYREDKIYLEDMSNHALMFNQEDSGESNSISDVVLLDSHLIIHNELNQLFEAEHTNVDLVNLPEKFMIDVKGRLAKKSSPFQFGLVISKAEKKTKTQIYIAGENIALADLQFFFKDVLISGQANSLQFWLEGEWANFTHFLAKGKIENFEYIFENRKLFYPHLSGQFGIEWQPDATKYLGLNISTDAGSQDVSQFYVSIPTHSASSTLLAKNFPLSRLDNIFSVFLADKPALTDWWQKTLPRGYLDYFNVNLPDIIDTDPLNMMNQLSEISGEIMVHDLVIKKNPFHLSVDKIADFTGYKLKDNGKFSLKGENVNFQDSQYYPDGLHLDHVSGTIWYWNQSDRKKIYFDDIIAKAGKAKVEYDGFWEKNIISTLWETEGLFFQENIEVNQLASIIPKSFLDKGLSEWLQSALKEGNLKRSKGLIRGKLKDFPYTEASNGVVEAELVIEDAFVQYEPSWPELKKTDGKLELDGPELSLMTTGGEIANSQIRSAKGLIPNISAPYPSLAIDAEIDSTFTEAENFIEHSPLKNTLGEKLKPLRILGPVNVLLDLNVPLNLNSPEDMRYRGLINFENSTVQVPKFDLNISSLNGSIFFSPRGISGDDLSGKMFGTSAKFTIASDVLATDPRLKVSAKGQIDVSKLGKWFNISDSELIGGKSNYKANLFLKNTTKDPEGELNISSDLSGIAINLPEPFQKKSDEKEEFDLNVKFSPQSIINMKLKYGQKINIDYELKTTQKTWVSNSAHVVLGAQPAKTESESLDKLSFFSENPFSVEGHLETLDLSEWQTVLSGSKNTSFSSNFLVKLHVKKLKAFGQDFENMTIELAPSGLLNREITILGEDIKGKVILPVGPCTGSIKANFDYLSFPKRIPKEGEVQLDPLNAIKTKAGNCPIELTVKKLDLNKKIFEEVFIHLIPNELGFQLKDIRAKAPFTFLQASGVWTLTPKSNIELKGIIQTKNIQNTLQAGGIESTLHAATGQIRFDLNWEKDLSDIDLNTVSGDVTVFLRNGYIKGAEPGIGRILSLLSIDNIQRRLKLDFSDVAKEGLSMDKLTASFHFNQGIMKTDDLVLDSPAARIELLGQAVLDTKIIEGTVKVMPKITGSLPVAAAIAAANPAVGALVWMADKALGRTIQEMTHYQYQLSGTLDKPKLNSK